MKKKNKYNATKIEYGGKKFDSKKELVRYQQLEDLQKQGIISDLQTQVEFTLLEPQMYYGKVVERAIKYRADFVYMRDGEKVVEDVKGYKRGEAYRLFVCKRKLMLKQFGVRVKEI